MSDDDRLVHATWSRSFPMVTVLAFGDRSYTVMFGSARKPPLVQIGWAGWRPNFISFPRWQRL
jgi:hypothetical protein